MIWQMLKMLEWDGIKELCWKFKTLRIELVLLELEPKKVKVWSGEVNTRFSQL